MTTRFPLSLVLTVLCALPSCGPLGGRVAPAAERGGQATQVAELRALAEQGNAADQFNLGVAYDRGRGVSQDYEEAVHWYRLAAMQGYSAAQYNLGVMSDKGQGLPQDYQEALRWSRLAAGQGQERAMYNLGLHYQKAWGVSLDMVQAHMWYNLAAAYGSKDGVIWRDRLAQFMTPAQIAEAHKLAREWKLTGK